MKRVGSGQWAVGSGQWAVDSGQWAVGSWKGIEREKVGGWLGRKLAVGGRSVKVAVGGFDDVRGVNEIYKTNPFSYFAKGDAFVWL